MKMIIIKYLKKLLQKRIAKKMNKINNKVFNTDSGSNNKLVSTTTTIINRKKISKIVKSDIQSQYSLFESKSSAMSKITKINHKRKLEPIVESNCNSSYSKITKRIVNNSSLCTSCLLSKIKSKKNITSDCKCCGKRILKKDKLEKYKMKNVNKNKRHNLLQDKFNTNIEEKKENVLSTDYNEFILKQKRMLQLTKKLKTNGTNNSKFYNKYTIEKLNGTKNNIKRKSIKSICKTKMQYVSNNQAQPCCLINGKPLAVKNNFSFTDNYAYSSINSNKNQNQLANMLHTKLNFKNSFKNNLINIDKRTINEKIYAKNNLELKKFKGMVNILSGNFIEIFLILNIFDLCYKYELLSSFMFV
jgi:hypothetical protein